MTSDVIEFWPTPDRPWRVFVGAVGGVRTWELPVVGWARVRRDGRTGVEALVVNGAAVQPMEDVREVESCPAEPFRLVQPWDREADPEREWQDVKTARLTNETDTEEDDDGA